MEWLEENVLKMWRWYGGYDYFYIVGWIVWDFCRLLMKVNWWGIFLFNNLEMENIMVMVFEWWLWRDDEVVILYLVGFYLFMSVILYLWIEVV